MGSSTSTDQDLPPLPQQRVVNVGNGGVSMGAVQARAQPSVNLGQSKQAVAVKPPLALHKSGFNVSPTGKITVEVSASVDGIVEAIAPALERPDSRGGAWPNIALGSGGQCGWRRAVSKGECQKVHFDRNGEALAAEDRQNSSQRNKGGVCRWPVVLLLRPGTVESGSAAADDPPDGTLMACCVVVRGQLQVVKRIVAWGGAGAAYVLQEVYGIQEAQPSADAGDAAGGGMEAPYDENQRNCVVCLTTPKDTTLLPCGHYCVCNECGRQLRLRGSGSHCPLCRKEIQDILHIKVDACPAPGVAA